MHIHSETRFIIEDYTIYKNEVVFRYSYLFVDGASHSFAEKLVFGFDIVLSKPMEAILRQLHIGLSVSYYKAFLGDIVLPYKLSAQEAAYWNTVFFEGLGEFAYINNITKAIRPFYAHNHPDTPARFVNNNNGVLLGIGGGKDSIVAGELLKKAHENFTIWELSTGKNHGQAGVIMQKMGVEQLAVERYIDTTVSELAKSRGGYSGHIPISMIFAWVGVFLAVSTNKKYVVMGNEAATNVENLAWEGRKINHQWSKSLEFEVLMQNYLADVLCHDIKYFSLLRPIGSLKVMELFIEYGKKYLADFTSCNLVFRIDPGARPNNRWCGNCAKCLSTYLLLSIWLNETELADIFGERLLDKASLQSTMRELLGLAGHKPMDCVGTVEELRATMRKFLSDGKRSLLSDDIDIQSIVGRSYEELRDERHSHNLDAKLLGVLE